MFVPVNTTEVARAVLQLSESPQHAEHALLALRELSDAPIADAVWRAFCALRLRQRAEARASDASALRAARLRETTLQQRAARRAPPGRRPGGALSH